MKNLKVLIAALSLLISSQVFANNYIEGDQLTVVAPSGLKLRADAHTNSQVLKVIDYGSLVEVLNTFSFEDDKSQVVDWIKGQWIYISYEGIQGYVFDSYLSRLPLPMTEDEFCIDCQDFVSPLENYFDMNFAIIEANETMGDLIEEFKFNYILENDITMVKQGGYGWWGVTIEMEGYRMSDALNIFRSMILNKKELGKFEKSLIYVEDENGEINKIQIRYNDNPVTIKKNKQGNIVIEALTSCC